MSQAWSKAGAAGFRPTAVRTLVAGLASCAAARGARRLSGWLTASGSPPICIGHAEHRRLSLLAMVEPGHDASASDALHYELDRARVVPDAALERGVVRMGSIVTCRTGGGALDRVAVVYPAEADARLGKVSVLSPLGTALIGLREGQSIAWMPEQSRRETVTVIAVAQPHAISREEARAM